MTTIAVTFSRQIRMPKPARRTFLMPGYLNRFRSFIETSDWDELLLSPPAWLEGICQGILIAAVLCFTPIAIRILLR